ncbi:MAG: NmrA/HSCARG family protein [Myxococcota bacterium]
MSAAKKTHKTPILVTGATGKQGGAVTRHLVAGGHRVRALTRDPTKPAAQALSASGVEVVQGDLEDRESLVSALRGAAGLYAVQDFLEAGVEAEQRQGLNLLAAVKESAVEHVVYTGASTMDRATAVPHLDSKWRIEMALRESSATWTCFRPAAFMDNWEWDRQAILETGRVRYPLHPEMPYAQIACDDIGRMVTIAFEQPTRWANKAAPLAGDVSTMEQLTKTIGEVVGRELTYQQMSWDEARAQQGEELMLMYRAFDTFGMDGSPYFLRRWLGEATDFESYLRLAGWQP